MDDDVTESGHGPVAGPDEAEAPDRGDEQEWDQNADTLMDDAEADRIRDLRRRRLEPMHIAGGTVGFGDGDTAGTINHYYGGTPQSKPVDGPVPQEELDRRRDFYVQTDDHAELLEKLHVKGVAVLRGAPGSGRYTTALLAAQESKDADVVVLDPEAGLKRLVNEEGFQPGHGHVVEGDGMPWAATLRAQLLNRLRTQETYRRSPLVIVVDDQVPVDGLSGFVVEHGFPYDLRLRVLERHLTVLLPEQPEACRKLLDHEIVREELGGRTSMTAIAFLAEQLARGERNGEDTDQIVQGLRARLRARAEGLLGRPDRPGESGARRSGLSLWSHAFLLACVVLDGMPLSRVSRESHRLAELLHGVRSPSSVPEMPLFEESLKDWLNRSDVQFTDRDGNPTAARHPECRVRFGQSGLGEAVLEVLWHEHSGARRPLLDWLDGLVTQGDEDTRVAAAQTAGLLATFDWAYVLEELFVPWATDRTAEYARRRSFAAAWALERAISDPALVPRVQALLREWCRRPDFSGCAEAAYGTRIGAAFPVEALDNLEAIASRARGRSVRIAVQEIYAAGSRSKVVERLAGWSETSSYWLIRDAAMCLERLSRFTGPLAITGFLVEQDAEPREHLLRLTRNVLFSHQQGVRQRGWNTLRLWVDRAGDEPELVDALAEFITELPSHRHGGQDDGLRERFLFYLRLWEHQGADAAEKIVLRVTERWSI